MSTYIVFRPQDLERFAYCIAPVAEVNGVECYQNSAVELVTDFTVEPLPLDRCKLAFPIRNGCVHDREAAIHRVHEALADDRHQRCRADYGCFLPTEVPIT